MDAGNNDQTQVDDRTIHSRIERIRKKLRAVDEDLWAVETFYGIACLYNDEMKIGIEVRAPSIRTLAEQGPARLQLARRHVDPGQNGLGAAGADRVRKAEVQSGCRSGISNEMVDRLRALTREIWELAVADGRSFPESPAR